MKPISEFDTNGAMALLLAGESGTGKTNLAMEWPNPFFVDWTDANLKSAVERHPGKTAFFARVDIDEQGKEVPPDRRWERGSELLKKHGPAPKVGTIVDDCLSMLQVALQDHIVRIGSQAEQPLMVGGVKVMTKSCWSAFQDLLRKRIFYARSLNKPYILTCHLKVDAEDVTGVKFYRPLLSGALGDYLPGLFSDYWVCETDPNADKKKYPTGVRHYIRTVPNSRMRLKCSCGLPPEMEFTWPEFSKIQDARAKAAGTATVAAPVATGLDNPPKSS
jgi:hypothetical protein